MTAELSLPLNLGHYDHRNGLFNPKDELSDPFYRAIIQSRFFRRLADVRFLGAIDYIVMPNQHISARRNSRYAHTLGVAALTKRICRNLDISKQTERLLVSSALLHDIGHGPFSHSSEKAFFQIFGFGHHEMTRSIIYGRYGSKINEILRFFKISPFDVCAMLTGESSSPHVLLFSSPVNVDTLDAIPRAYSYIASRLTAPVPDKYINDIVNTGLHSEKRLDGFWNIKNDVYKRLIFGHSGAMVDCSCKNFITRNAHNFKKEDFLLSDSEFFTRYPAWRRELRHLADILAPINFAPPCVGDLHGNISDTIYFVNRQQRLHSRNDIGKRYLKRKPHTL